MDWHVVKDDWTECLISQSLCKFSYRGMWARQTAPMSTLFLSQCLPGTTWWAPSTRWTNGNCLIVNRVTIQRPVLRHWLLVFREHCLGLNRSIFMENESLSPSEMLPDMIWKLYLLESQLVGGQQLPFFISWSFMGVWNTAWKRAEIMTVVWNKLNFHPEFLNCFRTYPRFQRELKSPSSDGDKHSLSRLIYWLKSFENYCYRTMLCFLCKNMNHNINVMLSKQCYNRTPSAYTDSSLLKSHLCVGLNSLFNSINMPTLKITTEPRVPRFPISAFQHVANRSEKIERQSILNAHSTFSIQHATCWTTIDCTLS
jgi:hypothetical protein